MGVLTICTGLPTDHPTLGKVYLGAGGIYIPGVFFRIFASMDYIIRRRARKDYYRGKMFEVGFIRTRVIDDDAK